MTHEVYEWLRALAADPWLCAAALAVATLALEDAVTVAAGLLAAEGLVSAPVALAGLWIGIIGGDLWLYGLGALASRRPWARRLVGEANIARGRGFLDRNLVVTLVSARSIPGMRLPTYAASGFVGVSLARFTLIACVAVAIWTTAFFYVVRGFGVVAGRLLGSWSWAVGALLLLVAMVVPRVLARRARGSVAEPSASEGLAPGLGGGRELR
ncbi:MAG: VTT domain-containing protein [Nannocystaceae bacterium]|nr:VTT domain-containing protein [Myxococcales bacterium]